MKEWFYIASRPRVVRRSLKFGVVVGTILIVINHGAALMEGDFSAERLLRMGLTVMVPYFVSTSSSVCAMKEQAREKETGDVEECAWLGRDSVEPSSQSGLPFDGAGVRREGCGMFDVIAWGREWLDGVSPHLVKSVCYRPFFNPVYPCKIPSPLLTTVGTGFAALAGRGRKLKVFSFCFVEWA
jgi:hypothetical protein